MKISYFYSPQVVVAKDTLFCEYTDCEFLHQTCDSSVDLIYAGSVSVLSQAMLAKQRFNKPLVCWCWDIPYNWRNEWGMSEEGLRQNAHRDGAIRHKVELLKNCDLVISASRWTQGVLKEQYNIDSEQIYFYIDTHGIDSVSNQIKENRITQISRYFYNKKFEHTVVAAKNLNNYKTVFMGTGLNSLYGNSLQRYSDRFNKNVVFHEKIDRKKLIIELKKSTILVSPSVFEGWGITPIEALYCKIPVLLSDLEVFKEVYGDNVLYHKRHDVNDMKEKLELLVSDKELQKKIVNDCQPIISEFTAEKFALRWKKIVK